MAPSHLMKSIPISGIMILLGVVSGRTISFVLNSRA